MEVFPLSFSNVYYWHIVKLLVFMLTFISCCSADAFISSKSFLVESLGPLYV